MKPARLFFASLLRPLAAIAGSSANYTLTPDTVDGGGLRGTSANYTVDFSAAPGSAGESARYTVRGGFAGQLSDATAIDLTALRLRMKEGTTRQLGARLVLDDLSASPLTAGDITWSVLSGPIAGISAAGLATAAAVYQDSAAVVKGTYQTFTDTINLTVVNSLPDNFESYAGDGIPDDWQVLYFGLNNPVAGPLFDPDSDGHDNLFEYHACLVPTDPLSLFSMSIANAAGGGHQIEFSPRFPDCTYVLQGSRDLSLWAPVAGTLSDAGPVRTIVDPAGMEARRFYYITIRRQ